jgi:DNA (cytosine-5)-methyltransferase 1
MARMPEFESHVRSDWPDPPCGIRVADGVAHRMERTRAVGNGQVPRVAATAFDILSR